MQIILKRKIFLNHSLTFYAQGSRKERTILKPKGRKFRTKINEMGAKILAKLNPKIDSFNT